MIEKLIQICKKIEKNRDKEKFPSVAFKALEEIRIDIDIEEFESLVVSYLNSKKLLPQLNLYNNFGEPSLTIFNNGDFALDIYFWRKNDTLIHSHGFRGAFKILYGLSLHEEFSVKGMDSFSEDVLKNKISQKSIKIMKKGDVQKINPGMELTHRVVHLSDPTVSLCLRTVEDTELSQWHHLSTGLSFKKNHVSEKMIKKTLYSQYLIGSDEKKARDFFIHLIDEINVSSQIALYESICFDQLGLSVDSSEFLLEIMHENFQKTKWFEFYQKHYENSQKNLQEFNAKTPEIKLLAHAINNNYSLEQATKLLGEVSDKDLLELCGGLKETPDVFTEGFEDYQLNMIDSFLKID